MKLKTLENGYEAAKVSRKSLLLLDRYFLSVPALKRLEQCNSSGAITMHLVTNAKKSCIAFEQPPEKKPGRGRPPIEDIRNPKEQENIRLTVKAIEGMLCLAVLQ